MNNKYIPNLARFYFKPDMDWDVEESRKEYDKNLIEDYVKYGDCVSLMKGIDDGSIDSIVTDPPFGLGFSGKEGFYNRDKDLVIEGYEEVDPEDYLGFSRKWISEACRVLKSTGTFWIFSGWTNLKDILISIDDAGLKTINHIIWHYNFAVYTSKKFSSGHYHVLLLTKDEDNYFFNKIEHYEDDVWEIKRVYAKGQKKNGTKLPMNVVRKCINYGSAVGDVILDPFLGNGTVACAAKGEFRHYIGFEKNENMKDVIDSNIRNVNIGEYYTPYENRLPTVDELSEKYPRAYREYLNRERKIY
jgi:site-specific DNA-methyltransferase (adenine-specific)